ncbi:acyl-CoA dehydrogenase family protein [Noviherbaspirillum saxi]|nr:acyl-CoA dehydrogenase family protein [Noviherbaspirillum saxi]
MEDMDDVAVMLRDAAVGFIEGRYDASLLQENSLKPRPVDRKLWNEMADIGWLGLCLPESVGGSGLGLQGATVLAEVFGRTLFSPHFAGAVCMPSEILRAGLDAGGESACESLASLVIGGERLLALAWQEQAGQMQAGDAATVLRNGRVSGKKIFVPAVENDSILLVTVSTPEGPAVVAVACDADGVTVEQAAAGLGSIATVTFNEAPLWQEQPVLQGPAASAAVRNALAAGRIVLSAQLAGLASGCLEKNIRYVNERIQFGRAIGSFQTIQHRCVDLHIDTLLAGSSWRNALRLWETRPDDPATEAAISAAKARCGDAAMKVARQSVQMHGAMGFAEEVDVGFYLRAAMHAASYLGNALQHRRLFADPRLMTTKLEESHA